MNVAIKVLSNQMALTDGASDKKETAVLRKREDLDTGHEIQVYVEPHW